MKRIRLTREAQGDLDEIWGYVAVREATEEPANRLIDEITERFATLAAQPKLGLNRDRLRPGLRSFPVGTYIVYYRETKREVVILGIVHGRRDQRRMRKSQ